MLSPFLGVTSKAPEWRNPRIQEVYSDFVCDFIEAFLCKYLKSSEQQTIPFYDAIKLITSWRMSIKSQGSVKLTELAEEQVIEKALNHILGVHFLPDCVKKQKSLFFQYDDEERLITFTEDQPFSFQLLPADNSPDEKFPSPCDIPKELLEKLTFKMIKGEKEWYLSENFLDKTTSWWRSVLLERKQAASEIINKFGCLARFIVLSQEPADRESYQNALLKWVFNKINRQIFLDRSLEMDIFSISYSLTPNIPFLIDYDFLYYGLMRKKSMTIDCQGSFYLIPSENNFSSVGIVLKRTDKVWQGWGSSRDSAKRSKQMKKSRATKSSDALHTMLGGFSINKRSCK